MAANASSSREASWQEYERLGEDIRCEYVDGRIVVTPFPTARPSFVITELQFALRAVLPADLVAVSHVGWKVARDEFGPDLMVVPRSALDDVRFEGTPLLVAEVVSTNRAADTVVKVQKYARAGAPRYWIVDVRDRTLLALVLVDGSYEVAAQLDDENPGADLETGAGVVTLSLPDLLS
jgi:Uma2 family endonuclease